MPQSLVHEFLDQRSQGNKVGHSLKKAVFQAQRASLDVGEVEDGKIPFKFWKVHMRGDEDDEISDWWFASTAVPILAATLGPMANVLSIGALISYWRQDMSDPANPGKLLAQPLGTPYKDPRWCYWVNVVSLIAGFVGNLFLLLNFTQRVRYLIALPFSIILWFFACFLLVGDLLAVHIHAAPVGPTQIYSGGFWYGIAAASMYLILTALLMLNLLGFIRGHYPRHFELTEDQRTLIVQTMLFFIWLAGGAAVYSRLEGWRFIDALYYVDVTVLTVGFGDLYPSENAGRALLIPYSVIGIIMLGLVIGAIFKSDKTVRSSLELERKEIELELARERAQMKQAARPSARSTATGRVLTFAMENRSRRNSANNSMANGRPSLARQNTMQRHVQKQQKIILLKEEKERFEAMRGIQKKSEAWRAWYRLTLTLTIFLVFWCVGAVFFWQAETATLGQTYWQSIYFCWVSLLSIGYGDFSPKTGAGRCFFFIWSLIAVPTMTILASDLTSTVVAFFNHWSNTVADFTVLPSNGLWRTLTEQWPKDFIRLPRWLKKAAEDEDAASQYAGRIEAQPSMARTVDTMQSGNTQVSKDEALAAGLAKADINTIASQHGRDVHHYPDANALARQLALAIRRTATDLQLEKPREYTYEEWVEFTRLIRFSALGGPSAALQEDDDEGMIEWDWIGEDSPMMAQQTEPEFVLDRLCESLVRYVKRNPAKGEFAQILREKGERALKLKGGAGPDGDEDVDVDGEGGRGFDALTLAGSVRSGNGFMKGGEKEGGVGGLDPLHEHDDEYGDHGLRPVAIKEE
ncbi:hypothetical protein Vi05172_g9571 [Venturia inaequalis]|nr:hypothetical protein Vi05172_g9571 [Venturia inaequalis]